MSDNGIIGLGNSYNSFNPRSLPINDIQFIAPYWADFDLTGTGNIFYRQTRNPALLARATNEIRAAFPMSKNVIVINLLIATWDAVGYFNGRTDKVGLYYNNCTQHIDTNPHGNLHKVVATYVTIPI